jgi:predicted RecA/RadA family phage recombinase
MSANYIGIADVIDYTPSGAVDSGDVVVVGGIVGVATEAIAADALGALAVEGQFELDLASGKTFSAGDAVYVDDSEATDSGTFFGWAVADSDATAGTVMVKLVQVGPDDAS